jgi:hypothetical protein
MEDTEKLNPGFKSFPVVFLDLPFQLNAFSVPERSMVGQQ